MVKFEIGSTVAQIICKKYCHINNVLHINNLCDENYEPLNKREKSDRGDGGFGSTGM